MSSRKIKAFVRELCNIPVSWWPQFFATRRHLTKRPDATLAAELAAFQAKTKTMSFTSDWFSYRSYAWLQYLHELRTQTFNYLEIGT